MEIISVNEVNGILPCFITLSVFFSLPNFETWCKVKKQVLSFHCHKVAVVDLALCCVGGWVV